MRIRSLGVVSIERTAGMRGIWMDWMSKPVAQRLAQRAEERRKNRWIGVFKAFSTLAAPRSVQMRLFM